MSLYGDPLTFLHWSCAPQCIAVIDKQFDGYGSLQFLDRGHVELFYDNERQDLPSGDTDDATESAAPGDQWFWCCWPGPRIRFHAAPGTTSWSHRHVACRGALLANWQSAGLFPLPPLRVHREEGFAARFDELLALLDQPDQWSRRRAINRLEGLLLDLAARQHRATPETQPLWLQASLAELADGCTTTPDYADMAARHHMALSTFRRRFSAATGMAPHAYLLQCRHARACRLLAESSLAIKEIADALGYRDVYFFSRQFRDAMGTPPGAWRRSMRDRA